MRLVYCAHVADYLWLYSMLCKTMLTLFQKKNNNVKISIYFVCKWLLMYHKRIEHILTYDMSKYYENCYLCTVKHIIPFNLPRVRRIFNKNVSE